MPFLSCSRNNRTETVYRPFVNAVSVFGLPKQVRTDSVHNVRIERLWRDVRQCVVDTYQGLYRGIFSRLEHE